MMKKYINLYKAFVLSGFALLAVFLTGAAIPSHAADYSVGANGWNGYNSTGMNGYTTTNTTQTYANGVVTYGTNSYVPTNMYNSNTYTAPSTSSSTSYTYTGNNYYPKVVHGMPPMVSTGQNTYNVQTGQNTGVTVYAQNVTPTDFTTTICALDTTNGRTYQVGCVPQANFTNAANGAARFDFNAWPVPTAGQHSMTFTYRDASGNWQPIQTPWNQNAQVNLSI
jgi:hypothetical protein